MPYCCQCGTEVGAANKFCATCGAPQPFNGHSGTTPSAADLFAGISDRTAALLCYIPGLGWIASVIVIASQRFKRDTQEAREVRFHAFQGLYLFVAWLIVDWVVSPVLTFGTMGPGVGMGHGFRPLGGLLHLGILAAWIVMLIKVSRFEHYRLPIIGEMAERSVHEQGV
jgi:uncharacterized membrane protein